MGDLATGLCGFKDDAIVFFGRVNEYLSLVT